MEFLMLKSVIEELSGLLSGARVGRAYQGADGGIYLVLRKNRKNYALLLSAERGLPRIHLVSIKPAAAAPSSGFALYLKSRLTGARIEGIGLLNEDRIAEIRFVKQDHAYRLIFELFGPLANVIVTDAENAILAVRYPSSPDENVKRLALPGFTYAPPEMKASRRVKSPDHSFNNMLFPAGSENPANRRAELYYEQLIKERSAAALRSKMTSIVKTALKKADRRAAAVSADMETAGRAEEYRLIGDLILANLSRIEKRAERVELTGRDGERVMVEMDPAASPAENAGRYFKKFKKAKAGLAVAKKRLKEAVEEASAARRLLSEIESAEGGDALLDLRAEMAKAGYISADKEEGGRRRKEAAIPGCREFEHAGWRILVGRSAAGNDYIVTRLASPHDLWLHAEGMPGSHVLIRNPDRRTVPADVLGKAASLAAQYSKGRNAGKVPVTYTLANNVKKPKGAKPGAVTLSERKTIMARPTGRETP